MQTFCDLTTKALRNLLSSLKSHLDTVAQKAGVSPKTLATYLLLLCSKEDLDFSSAKVRKEIINKGNYSHIHPQLSLDKSAFLIDSLEIGKSKSRNQRICSQIISNYKYIIG